MWVGNHTSFVILLTYIMYDINVQTSLRRLVKGCVITKKQQTSTRAINPDRFVQLFEMCYDRIQGNCSRRNKMHRMLKGYAGACSRAAKLDDDLHQLTVDDLQEVKQITKEYEELLSQAQTSADVCHTNQKATKNVNKNVSSVKKGTDVSNDIDIISKSI